MADRKEYHKQYYIKRKAKKLQEEQKKKKAEEQFFHILFACNNEVVLDSLKPLLACQCWLCLLPCLRIEPDFKTDDIYFG